MDSDDRRRAERLEFVRNIDRFAALTGVEPSWTDGEMCIDRDELARFLARVQHNPVLFTYTISTDLDVFSGHGWREARELKEEQG